MGGRCARARRRLHALEDIPFTYVHLPVFASRSADTLRCRSAKNIYSWSNFTPLGKVKVVIIGQDPYHGAGQAHGTFVRLPSSPTQRAGFSQRSAICPVKLLETITGFLHLRLHPR